MYSVSFGFLLVFFFPPTKLGKPMLYSSVRIRHLPLLEASLRSGWILLLLLSLSTSCYLPMFVLHLVRNECFWHDWWGNLILICPCSSLCITIFLPRHFRARGRNVINVAIENLLLQYDRAVLGSGVCCWCLFLFLLEYTGESEHSPHLVLTFKNMLIWCLL